MAIYGTSLYWSGEDCLNEALFDMINDEFQQMAYQEETVTFQWFDRSEEQTEHVFDTSQGCFPSLTD